jgi:hypothetical protein
VRCKMPWRQLLLESQSIAVLSAAGVALLAFPGLDLAKNVHPRLTGVAVTAPAQASEPVLPKGPEARLTGASPEAKPEPVLVVPPSRAEDSAEEAAAVEPVAPPRARRAFEGCLNVQERSACRRALEATIERQGGFTMVPAGDRLGAQRPMLTAFTFDNEPQWLRRIEAISEEGIAFKRMRRGNDHELLIGITREGVLGFSIEERSSGR